MILPSTMPMTSVSMRLPALRKSAAVTVRARTELSLSGLRFLDPGRRFEVQGHAGSLPEAGGDEVAETSAPGLGAPRRAGHWWWWSRPWFDHQNLRDDRVEAFSALVWEGVYDYRYVARATTPGTFVVPPPRAEEMYSPETFGHGASDRVVVE